jgi:ABC-type transport system involved in multi-copper enzyme maturation permease subunit
MGNRSEEANGVSGRAITALKQIPNLLRGVEMPVLVQEMRVRQRGIKPFGILLAYLLILSAAALIMLYNSFPDQATASNLAQLGQQLYALLSFIQLIMVALIVPAYSSASVCGERERGTFDLLSLTLLSSSAIVNQKLLAAMGQALMLILGSVPIMAVVFLLGGVSPADLLVAYGLILVTAIFLGALGMICSCCSRSSKTSTFLTYLVMFCIFLGLPMGSAWIESMSHSGFGSSELPMWLFLTIFLFVGGVGAVLVYAPLSLILHRKRIWQLRAFRMSIFGGCYALLLLLVTCPQLTQIVMNTRSTNGIPLTCYMNPFFALGMYMDSQYGGTAASTAWVMIAATAVFCLGCTFIFRFVSSQRLAGLRSS